MHLVFVPAQAGIQQRLHLAHAFHIGAAPVAQVIALLIYQNHGVFVPLVVHAVHAFMAALANPPKDNPRLRKLLTRKPKWKA